MSKEYPEFNQALNEVSASSAGGSPFLIAYGATFLLTGVLSFFISLEVAALIAMFQGIVALPVAFWLERQMGTQRMSADNPLKTLSGQMAVSQALGIPALIVTYTLNPVAVPVVLAGFGGAHFLPYAWLHRTRLYLIMGSVVAIGAFLVLVLLDTYVFQVTLLLVGIVYWITAPLVYRHARTVVTRPHPGLNRSITN
jgi:hypothetical protein